MILIVLTLLTVKHFIADFLIQTKYQWSNKGTYLHPGGLLHAHVHAVATYACFSLVSLSTAIVAALIDFVVHYHIDWAKMNINKYYGFGPNTHEEFWWLLGFDQFLHSLTYIGLLYYAFYM